MINASVRRSFIQNSATYFSLGLGLRVVDVNARPLETISICNVDMVFLERLVILCFSCRFCYNACPDMLLVERL